MKYLAKVAFVFRVEIEADSEDEALDQATLGTTLASLDIPEQDMCEHFPSSAKIIKVIDD